MVKKLATYISVMLFSLMFLTGCESEAIQQGEVEPVKKDGIEIGLSIDSLVIERWQSFRTGS